MRKWVIGTVIVVVVVLVSAPVIALYVLGPGDLRNSCVIASRPFWRTHFESQVEISDFAVSLFPRVHVTITGLVYVTKAGRIFFR